MMKEFAKLILVITVAFCGEGRTLAQGVNVGSDPKATLNVFLAKTRKADSVTARQLMVLDSDGIPNEAENATIKAKKPNRWMFDSESVTVNSDGNEELIIYKQERKFTQHRSPSDLKTWFLDDLFPPTDISFNSENFEQFRGNNALHAVVLGNYDGRQTIKEYWIDPTKLVPLATRFTIETQTGKNHLFYRYSDVAYDVPLTAASNFTLKIPAGVTLMQPPPKLLTAGTVAPGLSLKSMDGSRITLAEALKSHKGVILNFWFVHCGFCKLEFPHLEAIYERLRSQGLQIYAVNQGFDKPEDIGQFLRDNKLSFPALLNEPNSKYDAVKAYHISGFPTNYLITPDGKISAIVVGFGGDASVKEMEDDLKKMGFSL